MKMMYTLEEAERIIEKRKAKRNEKRKYFFIQKMMGLGMIALGIASLFLVGELTVFIFMAGIGLMLLFTKEEAICL